MRREISFQNQHSLPRKNMVYTLGEGISIFGAVVSNILFNRMENLVALGEKSVDEIWWTRVLIFMVSSGLLVYFFL